MTTPVRILINGASGKMGQAAVKAIQQAEGLILAGEANKQHDLTRMIIQTKAQVVLDLTTAASAFINASTIIAAGVHPVIGTSGLSENQVETLMNICAQKKLGGIVVPNFSIGSVLSMQYIQHCARYFSAVEIIELHHHEKADAPSGTAMRTAALIAQVKEKTSMLVDEKEILEGARGAHYQGIPIHSIRLPGLLAHQLVMFGGAGEVLSIKHDVLSREAYMPGIVLACRKVQSLDGLLYGLEHIL